MKSFVEKQKLYNDLFKKTLVTLHLIAASFTYKHFGEILFPSC